ncbi:hypothetical protein P8X24_08305 [Pyrococcus kukulkanii]|uniref:hypothetical protein n=1 Tax=Pyrococcus kukulkanii TaxID=1609559 RepID=UPI003564DE17
MCRYFVGIGGKVIGFSSGKEEVIKECKDVNEMYKFFEKWAKKERGKYFAVTSSVCKRGLAKASNNTNNTNT